ncbi:hypothetical protein D3C87_2057290 [compost metagenome]
MFDTGHKCIFSGALDDIFGAKADRLRLVRRARKKLGRQDVDARLAEAGRGVNADRRFVDLSW